MNNKELIEYCDKKIKEKYGNNSLVILITKSGSHLYGTNTEKSDEDYLGIFIPDKRYYLGLNSVNEVDLSIKSKDDSGKNTNEAIDIKLYELKNFIKLASSGNPNIIELIFCQSNPEATIYSDNYFQVLSDNHQAFISKKIIDRFLGYAKSQQKKGMEKPQNFKKLIELKSFAEDFIKNISKNESSNITIGELMNNIDFKNKFGEYNKPQGIVINKNTYPRNYFVKKMIKMINEKLKSSSYRSKDWVENGYDTKFFMHLQRLLEEGMNLIKFKKLEFPLKNKNELLEIRSGKFTLDEVIQKMDNKLKEFSEYEDLYKDNLPDEPDYQKLEEIQVKILESVLFKNEKEIVGK